MIMPVSQIFWHCFIAWKNARTVEQIKDSVLLPLIEKQKQPSNLLRQ